MIIQVKDGIKRFLADIKRNPDWYQLEHTQGDFITNKPPVFGTTENIVYSRVTKIYDTAHYMPPVPEGRKEFQTFFSSPLVDNVDDPIVGTPHLIRVENIVFLTGGHSTATPIYPTPIDVGYIPYGFQPVIPENLFRGITDKESIIVKAMRIPGSADTNNMISIHFNNAFEQDDSDDFEDINRMYKLKVRHWLPFQAHIPSLMIYDFWITDDKPIRVNSAGVVEVMTLGTGALMHSLSKPQQNNSLTSENILN